MKCGNCGFENKDKAKFCTKCGYSLNSVESGADNAQKSGNSKYVIIALVIVIIILVGIIGYFVGNSTSDNAQFSDDAQGPALPDEDSGSAEEEPTTTTADTKEWVLIGSYSGSDTGTETINVPAGTVKVEISAYPIKNYATNHVYVSGSNGMSGGVDWGSTSAVETRSDSFTYTSSSPEVFTIDYYETVNWEVNFYSYE